MRAKENLGALGKGLETVGSELDGIQKCWVGVLSEKVWVFVVLCTEFPEMHEFPPEISEKLAFKFWLWLSSHFLGLSGVVFMIFELCWNGSVAVSCQMVTNGWWL